MTDLKNIINQYGEPKAIIDYANNQHGKKMIFDFEETICLNSKGDLLVNGKPTTEDCCKVWQKCIEGWKNEMNPNQIAAVGFFSYDFKNVLYPEAGFAQIADNQMPLFWFGKPGKSVDLEDYQYTFQNQHIQLKQDLEESSIFDKNIQNIKNYLYAGDVYQINYTQPMIFDFKGVPFELFMQIKDIANPKFGFYLDTGDNQVLSFSPEKFFTKNQDGLSSFPIKGTIKRLANDQEDKKQIEQLSKSIKDKAEHLMIVDLLRNDIGSISEFGSINVENLFSIKTFETIHHMETEIQGKLRKNITEIDIIKSLFPGGSITGAPKYRAMQIIDKIENYNRELYTGCIGSIQSNGDMDFNICIRTMTINNQIAQYSVGGGIVWDSTSESEYLEAREKANILYYQ